MANLTDADKVIRNDVGKTIASKLDDIADAIVQHGGGAESLGQLSDVDIDTTTLAEGQSIVYNSTTQKFENGEVSTVAALDDLTDVFITSAQKGDSLRNDGNGNWVNQPTTVTMTLAEWNAMSTSEQTEWLNSHKNTRLILTDAPNLNETAKQISYDGGTDTVWDKVEEVNNLPRPTTNITSARSDIVQWNTSVVPNTRAGTINVFFVFNNTGTAQPTITHTITCNRNILSMSMVGFNITTGQNSASASYDNGNIKWNTGLLQGIYICMGTMVFE